MKHWKKFGLLLAAIFIISASGVKGQSANKDYVIIRTMETFGAMGRYTPEMSVVDPNGKAFTYNLKKGSANKFGEDAGANGATIQKEILKWSKSGFEITSFSTDGGEAFTRTFIIMTKEIE